MRQGGAGLRMRLAVHGHETSRCRLHPSRHAQAVGTQSSRLPHSKKELAHIFTPSSLPGFSCATTLFWRNWRTPGIFTNWRKLHEQIPHCCLIRGAQYLWRCCKLLHFTPQTLVSVNVRPLMPFDLWSTSEKDPEYPCAHDLRSRGIYG